MELLSVHRPSYLPSRGKKTPFRLPFPSRIRSAKKLQKVTLIRSPLASLPKCVLHLGLYPIEQRWRRRGIRFSFRFTNNEYRITNTYSLITTLSFLISNPLF
jgi:hypothetical protein